MTVLRPDIEAALIVVLPPAALTNAEILHTVIAVRIDSGGSGEDSMIDDFA
jgi:hypothetical protein